MTTYLKVMWGKSEWISIKGGSYVVNEGMLMLKEDTVVGVQLREKEDKARVAFIDAGGYILNNISHDSEGLIENNPKFIAVYYTDEYLQTCEHKRFVKGWYYPPCECCVEEFEIPVHELPDDSSWEVTDEYEKVHVATPTVLLTMKSARP